MSLCRSIAAVLFGSLTAFACGSCADAGEDAWQPPRIVKLQGAESAFSYSPMYGTVFGHALQRNDEEDEPVDAVENLTYVLARPGELVMASPEGMFPYAVGDGTSPTVQAEAARTVVSSVTVTLELDKPPDEEDAWRWLRDAPPEALARVRFLMSKESLDAKKLAALRRLAEANPRVGLINENETNLPALLKTFDPPWLSIQQNPPDRDIQALLADEPNLHTLLLSVENQEDLTYLAKLPKLRTLALGDWKSPAKDQPVPVLPTMPTLRTLIVFGSDMKDLGPVGTQPNLEELAVVLTETLTDLGGLKKMPGLRALSLTNCKAVKDLSAVSRLKHLRWLALPPETSQAQFQTVCTEHPDLEVLMAVGCEKVTDLAPAAGLKRLRVLCAGTAAPLAPLANAKSLKLLGVHTPKDQHEAEQEKMSRDLVRVMEANPDLAVVQASPLCLGSGWILLLAPMTAAAWGLARRRSRPAGRHG